MARKLSQNDRLLNYLQGGYDITPAQAEARFGIRTADLAKRVYDLRRRGFAIYTNKIDTLNGSQTAYKLSTPSRKVIAAGYAALAMAKSDVFVANELRNRNII